MKFALVFSSGVTPAARALAFTENQRKEVK